MPTRSSAIIFAILGMVMLLGCQDTLGPDPVHERELPGETSLLAGAGSRSSDYRVVSISTLGGATGFARGINDRNEVVGAAQNAAGQLRAFHWRDGTMVELDGLGGSVSGAYDINNRGLIVGEAENPGGNLRAVLWMDGEVRELGTLGGEMSVAMAVNERGQVVGRAQDSSGLFRPFLWWRGHMQELPLPPGEHLFAAGYGINSAGDVVGEVWPETGGQAQQAVLWSRNQVIVLKTFCGETLASAISARGHIVGAGVDCPYDIEVLPLLWAGNVEDQLLEPLGGLFPPEHEDVQNIGAASAVNSRGDVVGWSTVTRDEQRATLWSRDRVINLGGEGAPVASAINERGVAAGRSGMTPALYVRGSQRSLLPHRISDGLDAASAMNIPRASAGSLEGSRAGEEWAVNLCGGKGRLSGPTTVAGILAGC